MYALHITCSSFIIYIFCSAVTIKGNIQEDPNCVNLSIDDENMIGEE